jgi:hypothetical protein
VSFNVSFPLRLLAGVASLGFASTAMAQQAETLTSAGSNGATFVLAGVLVAIAATLRRRVQASMWASREQAFTRRSQRAQRQRPSRAK